MSEMLNMVVGRLEKEPEIVPTYKGRFMLRNYIITEGDDGDEQDARIPIIAWENIAEEIADYKKGDLIHLLCVPTDHMVQVDDSFLPTLGFKVILVDHERKIAHEVNKRIIEMLK